MNPERTPPNSQEAEAAVVGLALAAAPECLPKLAELQEGDFFAPQNATIWVAVREVEKNRGCDGVNVITVWDALQATGNAPRVKGGVDGLLALAAGSPIPQQLEFHAQIIREKALLRKAIEFSTEIQAAAYAGEGAKEVLARIWNGAGKLETMGLLEEPVGMVEAISTAAQVIEKREEKGTRGDVKTHIENFDRVFDGLNRDEFIVVASPPGVGKSAFGGTIARNAAVRGKIPGLIISQEMSLQELVERIVSGQCATPIDKIAAGQAWGEFHRAAQVLERAPLWIEPRPMTIEQIVGTVHRWFARNVRIPASKKAGNGEEPLAFVLIDYLQIVGVTTELESRERELAFISRSLKMLAKQIHSPVMGISSLNRLGQRSADVPKLVDLRGSGAIEYDADKVFFLHRDVGDDPEKANEPGPAKLICAKNRGGRVGCIDLYYEGAWTTFKSVDAHAEAWAPEKSYVDGREHEP